MNSHVYVDSYEDSVEKTFVAAVKFRKNIVRVTHYFIPHMCWAYDTGQPWQFDVGAPEVWPSISIKEKVHMYILQH